MSGIANAVRGEFELVLGGITYAIRLSYAAIVAAEKACGRSIVELAIAASRNALSVSELAAVATEGIRAHGRETGDGGSLYAQVERIGELIVEEGIHLAMKTLGDALAEAVTGGVVAATGKPKATATTPGEATPAAA